MMRLVIISNRLPVTVSMKDNMFELRPSVGGLATGLKSFVEVLPNDCITDYLWLGWPGLDVEPERREELNAALYKLNCVPVYYPASAYEQFYLGFCNSTLWPLFHSFQTKAEFNNAQWENYQVVNSIYAQTALRFCQPGDLIWIHDYHLLLLPGLIGKELPATLIGFFLHIPFPSYEIFRLLSTECKQEIMKGMAGAGVIGFHTYDYAEDFIKSFSKTFACEITDNKILFGDRYFKTGVFPMGIDFERFFKAAQDHATRQSSESLRARLRVEKIILSIDRLDYTKGIVNRLLAYEELLRRYPEYLEKIALILVVVPSRTELSSYCNMKEEIDRLVGRINGQLSQKEWVPIQYQFKCKSFDELISLYGAADVALVTPLRDGMNLIAKEYVASRAKKNGVLILSETAGASNELIQATIINPYHTEEITHALAAALSSTNAYQQEAMEKLQAQVSSYNIFKWASDFINDLIKATKFNDVISSTKVFGDEARKNLLRRFTNSRQRLLLIDYDGTLVGFEKYPELAYPSARVLELLSEINDLADTRTIIMTGRDRFIMDKWLRDFDFDVVAENGAWVKRDSVWELVDSFDNDRKKELRPILENYVAKLPGSFIEEKQFAVTWHYRNAERGLSDARVTELSADLADFMEFHGLEINVEIKAVEVRKRGTHKVKGVIKLLDNCDVDFVACFGDDQTDEEVFNILPRHAHTFKVGIGATAAKFLLKGSTTVSHILTSFAYCKNSIYADPAGTHSDRFLLKNDIWD